LIPEGKIAEIRERADIVEIVGEYVTLTRAGANFKGVCPFHADSDPSFNVSPARQFYHCFGCAASGDVFSFIQRIEGLQFMEVAERLAAKYGIELPKVELSPAARTARERELDEKSRRFHILETATKYYEEQLRGDAGEPGRKVILERGVDMETAARFRLGFAPDLWQGLIDYMNTQRVSVRELVDVGLALPRKTGSGYYDRFRNRLVFPITDPSGHPIAFSARAMPGDDSGAKYINSPETKEYTKGKVLFGLHQARVAMSKAQSAVLVEGNFDVVAMSGAGFENVVAPLGTAFTEDHSALLRRRVEKVIVMFDGDRAGITAAARAFPLLAKAGIAAYTAPLPPGEDPDSLIRNKGKEAVQAILGSPRGLLDEIIRSSAQTSDGSVQDISRRVTRLAPFLDSVASPMERDIYRQKVASAFGVDPALIFRYLRTGGAEKPTEDPRARVVPPVPGFSEERELIGLLLDLPELCDKVVESGVISLIRTESLRKIADQLVYAHRSTSSAVAEMMNAADEDPAARWAAGRGMETLYRDEEIGLRALFEIRSRMIIQNIGRQVSEIDNQVRKAHVSGDEMMVFTLLKKRAELQKEMHEINEAFDKSPFRH
jgi:DNA primase